MTATWIVVVEQSGHVTSHLKTASLNDQDAGPNCGGKIRCKVQDCTYRCSFLIVNVEYLLPQGNFYVFIAISSYLKTWEDIYKSD